MAEADEVIEMVKEHVPQRKVAQLLGWITAKEMAVRVDMMATDLGYYIKEGRIPAPAHKLNRRLYYLASDEAAVRAAVSEIRHGKPKKEYKPYTMLSADQKRMVRALSDLGHWSRGEIAEAFGVCVNTVKKICKATDPNPIKMA